MNLDNGVLVPHLHTAAHHTPQLLAHLSVTALHGVEVQVSLVGAGGYRGGGAAAHANAVGGAADLDHQHADLGGVLLQVAVVNLAHAATEHDGLDPLAALTIGQALAKGACVSADQRLSKLVAVVRGTVGGVNQNLQRGGQVLGVHKALVLPGLLIAVHAQVAHTVASSSSSHDGASASGVGVTHTTASPGLSTWVWRHCTGEVVGLRSQQQVPVPGLGHQGGGCTWLSWQQGVHLEAANSRAVILERHHTVVRVDLPGRLDNVEQGVGHLLAVNDDVSAEKPVARVLAVGLGNVKQLHIGGVALHIIAEQVGVVVQVPLIKGQTHLRIDLLQSPAPLLHHGDGEDRCGLGVAAEAGRRLVVNLLCHAVMHQASKCSLLSVCEGAAGLEQVAAGALEAGHLAQPGGAADGDGIGGEGGGEVGAGPDLNDSGLGAAGLKLGAGGQQLWFKGLPQQPCHSLSLLLAQG
mmetsp:Transcript_11546/g.24752  ORF Transcript_11546/g.24752 Transcript_11546/m.24752 type:complete len:466 (-) Transcript_11546:534-1931(-)